MATKRYESMRIMSLEGSVLYKNEGFTATKDGKPDPKAFRGVLDESLYTLKLAEVYDRHKSEFDYPYLDGKKRFCRAVVSLSFNRAIKLYESYGNRYVLNGHSVTDADMQDHVCIGTVGGKPRRSLPLYCRTAVCGHDGVEFLQPFCRHRLRSGFLSLTMCSIGRHHTVTENKLSNPLLEGNILIKPMRHCFSY